MANFTYLENAHVFSKAPVQLSMEASSAVNKSAHTVQSDEVWGEVCPFITKNDVSGLTKDTLFEIEGYAPVKFNYKKPAIELDAINNNGMKSNGYVAKVIINGKPVTQFIADTDVTDENGTLAAGYRAVLYDKKGEEVPDSKYTINYSNGLIYFKEPIESTIESYYTLSFFTYEGKKLSSSIKDISDEISKIDTEYKAADELINEDIADLQEHASTSDIHVSTIDRENWDTVNEISDNLKVATASIKNLDDRLVVAESDISELDESVSILSSTLDLHTANNDIHVSESDRILWNKGGNLTLSGDDFIEPTRKDDTWEIALNYSATISSNTAHNINGNKKVPTVNATANCINSAITIHERTKGHLNLDEYALALSGGHAANLVSPKIENTSEYSISYPSEDDVLSTTNYSGLIIRNKNVKGRNSILKKLIIEGVSQSDEETLYAHIYRFSESDIYSGNADNATHIVSVKTNLSTPETIEIDFEEGLVIYKEYNYNITFTRTPNVSDTKIQLSYQYFSNNSETTYPVLITNDYTNGTIVADIFYVIPCTMILEDFSIPTSTAICNALYGYETIEIPKTYNTVWDGISASSQKANTGGFYFSVNQTITCNAIEIRQIVDDGSTKFSSAHIKIWDKATGNLLSKSSTMTTLSGGEGDTWDIDEMTFLPGTEYLITFNDNNTSSEFSAGYEVRFNKMASNLGAGYGLLSAGTVNPVYEGICPKVILKTIIPGHTDITKIIPEGLYDKHQTHVNDTFIHNNAIVDGLYDKTDNVVSYQEGLITYTDGTTETKDISDSISAQAAFRTSNGITPNLVSFNARPEFVDENGEPTSNRWYDGNYATKFDYEMDANAHSVAINESSSLGSLVNGSWMFTRSGLTMFNDDVNCLTNGTAMFFNSKNLNRFKSALPSLTVGQWMFKGCKLKEFKSKMPALSIAQGMFANNENLTTFNSLMPNLTVGIDMFLNCSNLTTFIVPPSSLKNLYYSRAMFKGCYNLNIFTGSLEALEQPYWMFNNCKLSIESIKNIANTVKDYTGIYQDNLTHDFGPIGIDCLAAEYDNSEFNSAIDKIRAKGWSLSLQFNKSTQTLNLDEPFNASTNILYVKKENLGETLNEYIDENLNTWALTYANKVYDLEGWTIFSSVEEAAEAWKLTPINK